MVSPVTQPQQAPPRRFRGRLGRRMALILLPLVVAPLIAMGIGAYLRSRTLLEEQATSQMASATEAQIQVLREWADGREQRLQLGSQRTALHQAAADLLSFDPQSRPFAAAQQAALAELADLRTRQGQVLFSDLLIARPSDGTVLTATREAWVGQSSPSLSAQSLTQPALLTQPIFDDPLLAPNTLAFLTLAPFHPQGSDNLEASCP